MRIFGIRHHGPGSARSLVEALQQYQPDCVLIEAPADAQSIVAQVATAGLRPPVAMVLYNPQHLSQAVYVPFAEFSPEWQAMQWGLQQHIPIQLMDLPMERYFPLDEATRNERQIAFQLEAEQTDAHISRDPLGLLAQLGGYTDSERWWEVTFEQQANDIAVFDAILDMMTALRKEWQRPETPLTLLREAWMRTAIRKAKAEFSRLAVVCGAWHAPVLQQLEAFKKSDDSKILRGLSKTKTTATWAPWSYERLSVSSGYGAGVVAPAWYELLWQNRQTATTHWMSKAAQLLRSEQMSASSAEVIEAIRLANTLTAMRLHDVAGQDELREAAVTVLCQGDTEKLDWIEKKLIIGQTIGQVPAHIAPPLQQDLEKNIKSARLTKAWQSADTIEKHLDLRNDTQLAASHLLHRLRILDIPWGHLLELSPYQRGSFREGWQLKWQPEFTLRLIEAGMLGNTILEAAKNRVTQQTVAATDLPELTRLTGEVLLADLPEVTPVLLQRLQDAVALDTDVFHLMEALQPLVQIVRYGNIRKTDAVAVGHLVDQIVPLLCIGLPQACRQIDDARAEAAFQQVLTTNHNLALLYNEAHDKQWLEALRNLRLQADAHPRLRGGATRLLYNKAQLTADEAAKLLRYELSGDAAEAQANLQWLSGFLHGSGLLLIHQPQLWAALNQWVVGLEAMHFTELLPVLRRVFAHFSASEREKMLSMAAHPLAAIASDAALAKLPERAERVRPVVKTLLGIS
ncbi:MAG TPA: DUF5682 family protein [Saprospiraceae bacterium]|nr:DUF5682 family protein [Saprospiraceae bacterium]HMP23427.1 DUF5682 family protein [Saprospiraceae bacterium]